MRKTGTEDPRANLEERVRSGNMRWLGAYITDNSALNQVSSQVLADFRELYGQDEVILTAAFDEATQTVRTMPGQLGIYVTAEAFEAVRTR